MGGATVKCHFYKNSESSCAKMIEHIEIEDKRTASVLKRVNGKYHDVSFGVDEV